MAMTQCQECNAEISDKAKVCPSCGAPNKPKKKPTRPLTVILAVALFGGIVVALASAPSAPSKRPLTPEELAAKAADDAADSRAMAGAKLLKAGMKDPDSFQLKQLLVMPDGSACYTYRATNSFNAKLEASAVLVPGKSPKMLLEQRDGNAFVTAWNARCTKPSRSDLTSLAPRFLN